MKPAVSGLRCEPSTFVTRPPSTVTARLHVSGQSSGQTESSTVDMSADVPRAARCAQPRRFHERCFAARCGGREPARPPGGLWLRAGPGRALEPRDLRGDPLRIERRVDVMLDLANREIRTDDERPA